MNNDIKWTNNIIEKVVIEGFVQIPLCTQCDKRTCNCENKEIYYDIIPQHSTYYSSTYEMWKAFQNKKNNNFKK